MRANAPHLALDGSPPPSVAVLAAAAVAELDDRGRDDGHQREHVRRERVRGGDDAEGGDHEALAFVGAGISYDSGLSPRLTRAPLEARARTVRAVNEHW